MRSPAQFVPAAAVLLFCALLGCSAPVAVREEPVRFSNGAITLSGTLVLPGSPGRHPAVVLFHGSAPDGRDLSTARWFAEQGVAALAYDKRGFGESTGDARQVPFMDLCGDGLAAVELLQARPDINPRRIGVWGISQGGWLGPLAASRSKNVAFVIAISGPGVSPGEQMIFYYENQLRMEGLAESDIAEASRLRRVVWQYLATGTGYHEAKAALVRGRSKPWFTALQGQQDGLFALSDSAILDDSRSRIWFRAEMNYDPTAALRKLSVPVLFVFGGKDELVPVPKSVEVIRTTLAESHARDFTIKIFPGGDHGIYVDDPHGGKELAPGYLDAVKQWLRKHLS